jgi:hypothetical protein
MKYLLLILVLFSCNNDQPSLPLPTSIELLTSNPTKEFYDWVKTRILELNNEYHLNIKVVIHLGITPFHVEGNMVSMKYAHYLKGEIHIWTVGYLGIDLPLDFPFTHLKKAFYHEYLHAIDEKSGQSCPPDHNTIFENRISELGWL